METKQHCHMCVFGAVTIGGFTLFGLYKLVSRHFRKRTPEVPSGFKAIKFREEELTLENFEEVLKKHTIRFNESGIMEEILPREFTDEAQLSKVSDNFIYAQGNQDLLSLSRVPSIRVL